MTRQFHEFFNLIFGGFLTFGATVDRLRSQPSAVVQSVCYIVKYRRPVRSSAKQILLGPVYLRLNFRRKFKYSQTLLGPVYLHLNFWKKHSNFNLTIVMLQIHQYWMATICKHEGKKSIFETLDEKLSKNDTLCSSWPGERLYSVWFVFDSAFKKLNWQKKVTLWLLQWLSCLFWKVETIV